MPAQTRDKRTKTCAGTKDDGESCGAYPKQGEKYCFWCKKKGRDGSTEAELVSLEDKRAELEASASIDELDAVLDQFLLDVVTGAAKEKYQTSQGKVLERPAQLKDRISAARELRARHGAGGDDANDLLESIADRVRSRLGI